MTSLVLIHLSHRQVKNLSGILHRRLALPKNLMGGQLKLDD